MSNSSLLRGLVEDLSIGTSVRVQASHLGLYLEAWAEYRSGDLSCSSADDASHWCCYNSGYTTLLTLARTAAKSTCCITFYQICCCIADADKMAVIM